MKKTTLIFCFYICFSSLAGQKFGLSIEAGQYFGINKGIENDLPFSPGLPYSTGSGNSRQLMLHYFPDSSDWFLSAGIHHLGGNPVFSARTGNDTVFNAVTRTTNSGRFILRISYMKPFGKSGITFSAGLILPLRSRTIEEFYQSDSGKSTKTTSTISKYLTIGFSGVIGFNHRITPRIRFFLNSEVAILNSQVKHKTISSYYDSRGTTINEAYPNTASREFIYHRDVTEIRNNEAVLPAGFNTGKPTDRLTYREPGSSIGFQAGFMFLF